jgi:hypothetical protein
MYAIYMRLERAQYGSLVLELVASLFFYLAR